MKVSKEDTAAYLAAQLVVKQGYSVEDVSGGLDVERVKYFIQMLEEELSKAETRLHRKVDLDNMLYGRRNIE